MKALRMLGVGMAVGMVAGAALVAGAGIGLELGDRLMKRRLAYEMRR